MNVPDDLKTRIDDYLDGTLDSVGLSALEAALQADPDARAYFVRYAQLHTDLGHDAKASRAGAAAIRSLAGVSRPKVRRPIAWFVGSAAALLFGAAVGWVLHKPAAPEPSAIAWLVNAQDCTWTDGNAPDDGLKSGTLLSIDRGLAEIRFRSGARVILSGPARLELRGENAATLHRGLATARVPEPAIGFELLSPKGKIIDLGTDFGVEVAEDGATGVYVFEGEVKTEFSGGSTLRLQQTMAVQVPANAKGPVGVGSVPADHPFTRAIVPPPVVVARTKALDFRQPIAGTVRDRSGQGTGFTHRLKWTGFALPPNDRNLNLNPDRGLELTTTNSDINRQVNMPTGEYLGLRLADLGFTGAEDFEIAADFPHIPALRRVGQFGVFVGTSSSRNIRGGLISKDGGTYTQNLVNNFRGPDTDSVFVGLSSTGDDLWVILKRTAGRYAMTVENRTRGSTVTLTTKQPTHLDGLTDLQVGIFGANTQSNEPKTLAVREVRATVWKTEAAHPVR
ncbi:MAG TPA: FecR domain-containing protein [Gemmataceae bacterium]|nr:FecR domain-containing protein [Gemmataceae bacterium]